MSGKQLTELVDVLHGQQKCIVKECPNLGRTYKEAYNWLNIFSAKRHGGQGVGSVSYSAGSAKLCTVDGEGSSQLRLNVWGHSSAHNTVAHLQHQPLPAF